MASVRAQFMDDAKPAKVIVSTYEELPRRRRRPISCVASSSTAAARAKASAPRQAGSYSRRALLLAYAQQLRRRRRLGGQQSGAPLLLEWGKWKAGHPVAGGDGVAMRRIGRNWCSRLRCCVRICVRTFLRRVKRIRENASCKKDDSSSMLD
ncbi:hypothetical protein SORBI_3001G122766 [Sorghum bicolor]|uniref:Uncharacterized protein n=1 Tax=Sorghum bicolor TaxID=4558 RepID=A0A1Z5S5D6_SORBI|nr:hypothetical protein SORBI_3001G122766 [Sorghum bicolor]